MTPWRRDSRAVQTGSRKPSGTLPRAWPRIPDARTGALDDFRDHDGRGSRYAPLVAGPVLGVELPGPLPDERLERLRRMLSHISDRFVEERPGHFDLSVVAESLGVVDSDQERSRPLLVITAGPGVGDEETFEAEHADLPNLEPVIGFTPTHDVSIIAMCNGRVDHMVTALLTAEVMALVGGVVAIEIHHRQAPTIRDLPGLIAITPGPVCTAYGTSELVRAWVAHPNFQLVK
ncbi:DUF6368 family protein [Microbispora rosea]